MGRMPALFVSHGAPDLVIQNQQARDFLLAYGKQLGAPDAIVVISAHYETDVATVTADDNPEMIYDFRGFQDELYKMHYPAPGHPQLAARVVDLIKQNGLEAELQSDRGYDHGTWVPLKLLYPEAQIPVVQLSVQTGQDPAHHVRIGQALAALRDDNILVIGSGSMTHNLPELFKIGRHDDTPVPGWVTEFGDWMHDKAQSGAVDDLLNYQDRAPHALRNHPTPEHLLPFFVALGAGGMGSGAKGEKKAERIHTSHTYGLLQMDAYKFN